VLERLESPFQLHSIPFLFNRTECCRPALGWSEIILENKQPCCLTRAQCTEHFDKTHTFFRRTGSWEKHVYINVKCLKSDQHMLHMHSHTKHILNHSNTIVRSILISKSNPSIYIAFLQAWLPWLLSISPAFANCSIAFPCCVLRR